MLSDKYDELIKYRVVNIITNKEHTFYDDYLYQDDTNITIINKIINYCYPKETITPNEIYAYSNNKSICFEYENINEMNHIIKDNKITALLPDINFVNNSGIQIPVTLKEKYDELFGNNDISDNTIYYFTLKDLFNIVDIDINKKVNMIELNEKTNDFNIFNNGIIKKFFPQINKFFITNYSNPSDIKKREKEYLKIKNLIINNYSIFKKINNKINDKKNLLQEDEFNFKLMKLSTDFKKGKSDNDVKIIKLFADFPLSDKYPLTKLLLEDYEDTYFKLYKKSLKLELSTESNLINKKLCKKFLKDYSEYIPLNIGFLPSFIKYTNVFFIKVHTVVDTGNIFFSFILHLNGNVDIIINNYYDIKITQEHLKKIVEEANILNKRIKINRIYSIIDKPELILDDNSKLEYFNYDLIYSLEKFIV